MNFVEIKEIMKEFASLPLTDLEIRDDGFEIKLSKANYGERPQEYKNEKMEFKALSDTNINSKMEVRENSYKKVTSPLVGVFYASPSPTDPPYVKVGDKVNKGDIVCIVEAMKMINEIKSPYSGVVKAIKSENEQMLEFGQVIMEIEE